MAKPSKQRCKMTPPKGPGASCIPVVTGGYWRLPTRLAAPNKDFNRTAGLSNKSNMCNGCKHL
eukprot:5099274-Heterocapsa_arctica.AAC.1